MKVECAARGQGPDAGEKMNRKPGCQSLRWHGSDLRRRPKDYRTRFHGGLAEHGSEGLRLRDTSGDPCLQLLSAMKDKAFYDAIRRRRAFHQDTLRGQVSH